MLLVKAEAERKRLIRKKMGQIECLKREIDRLMLQEIPTYKEIKRVSRR